MATTVVQPVHTELTRVIRGVAPEELDVTCGAEVALGFFQGLNVLHPHVVFKSPDLVLALVGHELSTDIFAGYSLVEGRKRRAICVWWWAASGELTKVTYPADSQIREVRPLHVVVNNPDLLRVLYGQAKGAVDRHCVSKCPVVAPSSVEYFLGRLDGYRHNVVQNELLLLRRLRPRDGHHHVLPSRVLWPV